MKADINKKLAVILVLVLALFLTAGCSSAQIPTPTLSPIATPTLVEQPVEVVSVMGPLAPINPGGPIVEVTLKNILTQPLISLKASLQLNRAYDFTFTVSDASPLQSGQSVSARQTLIGAGFDSSLQYSLELSGNIQNGAAFDYTLQVRIVPPGQ